MAVDALQRLFFDSVLPNALLLLGAGFLLELRDLDPSFDGGSELALAHIEPRNGRESLARLGRTEFLTGAPNSHLA